VVLETSGTGAKPSAMVKAFFLFGLVTDIITSDATGITIARSWNVMTPGAVKILLDVEFEAADAAVCMFPGVHVQDGLPQTAVSFLAERTSYPASVIVSFADEAVVIFTSAARSGEDPASIGIRRIEKEEEPSRLRVEVRIPGAEEPIVRIGPKPEHRGDPEDPVLECPAKLERTYELFLAFSPRAKILETAPSAALKRLSLQPVPKAAAKSNPVVGLLRSAAERVLETHLVEAGGVEGLRQVPESSWLSSTAGLALAVSLRRLFPGDGKIGETALRLADFSLKGQLPSGLFYESYHLTEKQWRGVKGQFDRTMLSLAQSARIADLLLLLAEDLEKEGRPFEKYFLAGRRFVDRFVDEKGRCALPASLYEPDQVPVFVEADRQDTGHPGRSPRSTPKTVPSPLSAEEDSSAWALFFPLARVLDRLGKDRYEKALNAIAARFSSASWDIAHPPSSRAGRDSDSEACLLAVRTFVELRSRGYRPGEAPGPRSSAASRASEATLVFASLLLPWIRFHGPGGERPGQPNLDGTLVDSFVRQRLLFAGYEAAYVLCRLSELAGRGSLKSLLQNLSRVCQTGAQGAPLGTGYFQHTRWNPDGRADTGAGTFGPVDSRRLASELLYGLEVSSPKRSGQSGRGARSRKPSLQKPGQAFRATR